MKPIEGKAVFPIPDGAWSEGLSERRYYIAAALQGFCANSNTTREYSYDAIAAAAIHQSDAVMSMLYPQPPKEPNQ